MVSRRVLYVVLLLAMFLISSEVAEARELTETSNYKEGKGAKIGRDARFECPNGCCGIATPYCRCCAYPAAQDQDPHHIHN